MYVENDAKLLGNSIRFRSQSKMTVNHST